MMLSIKSVAKNFGGVKAVNKCSFDIEENKITALIGPNGTGKTTLFNIISGLIGIDKGTIKLQNENITNLQPHKIRTWRQCSPAGRLPGCYVPRRTHIRRGAKTPGYVLKPPGPLLREFRTARSSGNRAKRPRRRAGHQIPA